MMTKFEKVKQVLEKDSQEFYTIYKNRKNATRKYIIVNKFWSQPTSLAFSTLKEIIRYFDLEE